MDLPTSVLVIWWAALIVTVLVVVPLAIVLLHRTLRAAMKIELYAARALEAGKGIAEHTAAASKLRQTLSAAPSLIEPADRIEAHSREIAHVLRRRAEGEGP